MTDRPAHPESYGHWDHSQISDLLYERDALRTLLMRAKDVLNDVAYPDGDLCVNADAEEMASSIDAALRT